MRTTCVVTGTILVFLQAACATRTSADEPSEISEAARRLIVMVGNGDGAGIVFGEREGELYVVTARHVVETLGTEGDTIDVYFRSEQTQAVRARIIDLRSDYDIAVLRIPSEAARTGANHILTFRQLGSVGDLHPESEVYPLGSFAGVGWYCPAFPSRILKTKRPVLQVEWRLAEGVPRGGLSGGALLAGDSKIVGMIVEDEESVGRAYDIDFVLDELAEGYPVLLTQRLPVDWLSILGITATGFGLVGLLVAEHNLEAALEDLSELPHDTREEILLFNSELEEAVELEGTRNIWRGFTLAAMIGAAGYGVLKLHRGEPLFQRANEGWHRERERKGWSVHVGPGDLEVELSTTFK